MPLHVAILASGSGTNAQAMFDHIRAGRLDVSVCLVICNRPGAKVLDRARAFGAPVLALDHTTYASREAFDAALVTALRAAGAELVVLAGYMRLLTPAFLQAFAGRVINLHPALLPSFPGTHGARDAQRWGVRISGCTVHFVDEEMDHGEVIIQAAVPAKAGESEDALLQRIHAMEHRIYPQALQWFAQGRVRREGRQVFVDAPNDAPVQRVTPDGDWLVWPPLEAGF